MVKQGRKTGDTEMKELLQLVFAALMAYGAVNLIFVDTQKTDQEAFQLADQASAVSMRM